MSQVLLSSNYKGYYATLSDLVTALPIGAENWWAQVEENNSVYIWNVDTQEWATGEANQNNKGYFINQAALEAAYPVGEAGWYAIVGSTDTIWIWDTDTEAWINSGTMGSVSSVFGRTGAVVAENGDYDASEITSNTFGDITATNVQDALEQVYGSIPKNLPFTVVTNTTKTISMNNGYVARSATSVDFTLPTTAQIGEIFEILYLSPNSGQLLQNANQTIIAGELQTLVGVAGKIEGINYGEVLAIRCINTDTEFMVTSPVGNFNVVES